MTGRHRDASRPSSSNTAYEALRDYVFAVIPLFMLMGEFLAKCGAARDLFALIDRPTQAVPGRLGVATVLANAVFAFVTGVSHRGRGGLLADRLSGDEASRLRAQVLARLHRRQCLPRHADPAVGADDRVGRADRAGDRQAVHRRHPARSSRGDRFSSPTSCGVADAAAARASGEGADLPSAQRRGARRAMPTPAGSMLARHPAGAPSAYCAGDHACSAASGSASSRRPKAPASAPRWRCCWRCCEACGSRR